MGRLVTGSPLRFVVLWLSAAPACASFEGALQTCERVHSPEACTDVFSPEYDQRRAEALASAAAACEKDDAPCAIYVAVLNGRAQCSKPGAWPECPAVTKIFERACLNGKTSLACKYVARTKSKATPSEQLEVAGWYARACELMLEREWLLAGYPAECESMPAVLRWGVFDLDHSAIDFSRWMEARYCDAVRRRYADRGWGVLPGTRNECRQPEKDRVILDQVAAAGLPSNTLGLVERAKNRRFQSELFGAACSGDVNMVRFVAGQLGGAPAIDALIDCAKSCPDDAPRSTALHCAAARGHVAVINELLEKRASVDVADGNDSTPLITAVAAGSLDAARVLIEARADVNRARATGGTALFFARNAELTRFLLQRTTNPRARNKEGATAMMVAAKRGDRAVVEVLAEVPGMLEEVDQKGHTAIAYAAASGDVELVKWFLARGADAKVAGKDGSSAWDFAASDQIRALLPLSNQPDRAAISAAVKLLFERAEAQGIRLSCGHILEKESRAPTGAYTCAIDKGASRFTVGGDGNKSPRKVLIDVAAILKVDLGATLEGRTK